MTNQHNIFISYRRSDSISEAGRVYDSIAAHFGKEFVFKDVFDIPYGVDFAERLNHAISQCKVVIVIIGKTWINVTDADGKRRLDDPEDFVRIEVTSALQQNILVIPLLVNGATMPEARQLPDDLKPLARRNAAQVRHDPDYHGDISRVIAILQDHFNRPGESATVARPSVNSKAGKPWSKYPVPIFGGLLLLLAVMALGITFYPRLRWVTASAGVIPDGAVPGGEEQGRILYICRARYQGGLYPGKIVNSNCYIGFGGHEIPSHNYEVLINPGNRVALRWVAASEGQVPAGAVLGGQEPERKLFICRASYQEGSHPGKVVVGNCNISYGSREIEVPHYEVLVQN